MTRLTGIIITHNEAAHITDCIESLHFADHVLVLDGHSTDATVALAQQAGAEVRQRTFDNFPGQRNAALEIVQDQTDWVLFLDADERITPDLADEIRFAILNPGDVVGYRIPRHNYIFGKLTQGAGWYPDYQTRLLRVGSVHYDPARKVHEVVQLDGEQETLCHHITHYNYETVSQFIQKQNRYVRFDAQIMHEQGIRPKPQNYILQPLRHFRWRFITLKGYQDGWHGLRLSVLMAWYELRKYLLLRGLWSTAP